MLWDERARVSPLAFSTHCDSNPLLQRACEISPGALSTSWVNTERDRCALKNIWLRPLCYTLWIISQGEGKENRRSGSHKSVNQRAAVASAIYDSQRWSFWIVFALPRLGWIQLISRRHDAWHFAACFEALDSVLPPADEGHDGSTFMPWIPAASTQSEHVRYESSKWPSCVQIN